MVDVKDIADFEALNAWLAEQSPQVVLKMAHRMAARVLVAAEPNVWDYKNFDAPFGGGREQSALAVVHSNLILQVLAHRSDALTIERTINYVDFAETVWLSMDDVFDPNVSRGLSAPIWGLVGSIVTRRRDTHFSSAESSSLFRVNALTDAIGRIWHDAGELRRTIFGNSEGADAAWWEELRTDAQAARMGEPQALKLSTKFAELWRSAKDEWRGRGTAWLRWIEWYEDILAGRKPNWALLEKVALIPNEIWEQGPGAVAEAIREIEDDNRPNLEPDLQQQVAALPAGASADVAKVRRAFSTHRVELPPTFDAVLGLITL